MEIRLTLNPASAETALETATAAFNSFTELIADTQSAAVKAQQLYGQHAYVEIEFNDDDDTVNCWLWLSVRGRSEILGSGNSWDEVFSDAKERAAEDKKWMTERRKTLKVSKAK